jgi:quinol monooxygenase YgiN
MLIIEGWIRFAPGAIDEVVEDAKALVAATRAEPGCISYALSVDVSDPHLLRIAEIWRDEAAMQAHAKTPHLGAFAIRLQSTRPQGMSVKAYSGEFQRTLMEA